MTLKEKIEVMEAFERGEKIECNSLWNPKWTSTTAPAWNWNEFCYRVVPKPKQVVSNEKWLCKSIYNKYYIVEGCANQLRKYEGNKRKLLDTYEVEL